MPPLIRANIVNTNGKAEGPAGKHVSLDPPEIVWVIKIKGNVVEVSRTQSYNLMDPEIKRGEVGEWTRESRMRLLKYLNVIEWSKIEGTQFLTLTYPDAIDHQTYELRSRDRFLFLRHLERTLGRKIAVLWRIEWKRRLSGQLTGCLKPHYHMIAMHQQEVATSVVKELWQRAIGYSSDNLQVDSRPVVGIEGASKYLAKYVSKSVPLDIAAYRNSGIRFGRHWGVKRKALIPLCPTICHRRLTDEETSSVRDWAATKWGSYDNEQGGSFTVLGKDSAEFFAAHMNQACQPVQPLLY